MPLVAGCTPYLPMKTDFGATAAVPTGTIPPEYAKFNAYDPKVGTVVASQVCATPFQPAQVTTMDASPGQLVNAVGTCAPHQPILGNGR